MIAIVEPKKYIVDLWCRPDIKEGDNVRMMRYVLRTDCEDGVLLHNVVTGQLVQLDREEEKLLEGLPGRYTAEMEELAAFHYLVPEAFDEHDQVVKMRMVLKKAGMLRVYFNMPAFHLKKDMK